MCAGSRQADGCIQEDHKEGEILKSWQLVYLMYHAYPQFTYRTLCDWET